MCIYGLYNVQHAPIIISGESNVVKSNSGKSKSPIFRNNSFRFRK